MSRSVAQSKDNLLASCLPVKTNLEPIPRFARPVEKAELRGNEKSDAFIQCLLRAIKVGNTAGLLARIHYYYPNDTKVSVKEAFRHANALSHGMGNAKVFVVQDLDGDRGYYLRMDAVLDGQYERRNLTKFLEGLCQDVDVLRGYFGCSFSAIGTLSSECDTDAKDGPGIDLGAILSSQTCLSV